ncbi:hypothetical protein HYZ64_02675 [Candidatus Berkelbacteria bacterium]|nr:hypothetical protein [Candidatus Berkelbacteria bacterium]
MPRDTKPKAVNPHKAVKPGRLLFAVPESPFSTKTSGWFITTGIGFAIVVAGLTWYHYYLPAIALGLGTALFYYFGIKAPERQLCAMTERGVTFRGLRYPFNYFSHFSIWNDEFGDGGVIVLTPANRLRVPLHLRFEKVHYSPIRIFLRDHLAEQLHSQTVLNDLVARLTRI